jgi:hypothetical protein
MHYRTLEVKYGKTQRFVIICYILKNLAISSPDVEPCVLMKFDSYNSALKTRGNTPKYGLIFHSSFIGRAGQKNKGRISRYLANKCSIASRIDCFSDAPTSKFGEALRDQVEERLNFYENGGEVSKNEDVMKSVMEEVKGKFNRIIAIYVYILISTYYQKGIYLCI